MFLIGADLAAPEKEVSGNNSFAFGILVFIFALFISGVAGYYSIVGLTAIFSGAVVAVATMGASLEIGKLLAASWLYRNWKTSPFLLKMYLSISVVVLMAITSMGIFGFLSRAHLEQVGPKENYHSKLENIEFGIQQNEKKIDRANKILNQFDEALKVYFDKEYVTRGLKEREKQKEERESLQEEIKTATEEIEKLSEEKFTVKKDLNGIESEVGPIKYVAALFFEDNGTTEESLDKAVRWMIILLIFVFDPLAVLLVIAANISLTEARRGRVKEDSPRAAVAEEEVVVAGLAPLLPSPPLPIAEEQPPTPTIEPPGPEILISQNEDIPATPINVQDMVEEAFKSVNTGFNFDSSEGSKLKSQLAKIIKKKLSSSE